MYIFLSEQLAWIIYPKRQDPAVAITNGWYIREIIGFFKITGRLDSWRTALIIYNN
jgi:hypothetical protein